MNNIYLADDITTDSIVDGEGLRAVIWFQGCLHGCPGCHNPETHKIGGGTLYSLDEVFHKIDSLVDQDGITLSGGDPFFQPEAMLKIVKYAKELELSVWVYTGYTYDELIEDRLFHEILRYVDVLVDGKFILEDKSFNYKYRGSKNQRVIDVRKSLEEEKVVLYYEDTVSV